MRIEIQVQQIQIQHLHIIPKIGNFIAYKQAFSLRIHKKLKVKNIKKFIHKMQNLK